MVVPVLYFAQGVVAAIPQASLAGVLIFIAYRMVAKQPLLRIWGGIAVQPLDHDGHVSGHAVFAARAGDLGRSWVSV